MTQQGLSWNPVPLKQGVKDTLPDKSNEKMQSDNLSGVKASISANHGTASSIGASLAERMSPLTMSSLGPMKADRIGSALNNPHPLWKTD